MFRTNMPITSVARKHDPRARAPSSTAGLSGEPLNYAHLRYFWAACRAGSFSAAAREMGVAIQTVSTQVRLLEVALGAQLLCQTARRLERTELGDAVFMQADKIFELGDSIPRLAAHAAQAPSVRFAVGISDGLPKLLVHRLLVPILGSAGLKLLAHEDEFDRLLAELAIHRLDIVLSDRPAPANPSLRVRSQRLGQSPVAWYAPGPTARRLARDFPSRLADEALLLPTGHGALRARLNRWLLDRDLRCRIAGEFEDAGLMATFAAQGFGILAAPTLIEDEMRARYGLERAGDADGVAEDFYLIAAERRVRHPLIDTLAG